MGEEKSKDLDLPGYQVCGASDTEIGVESDLSDTDEEDSGAFGFGQTTQV